MTIISPINLKQRSACVHCAHSKIIDEMLIKKSLKVQLEKRCIHISAENYSVLQTQTHLPVSEHLLLHIASFDAHNSQHDENNIFCSQSKLYRFS